MGQVASGGTGGGSGSGSGGGGFEVDVSTLLAGRGWLHTDAEDVAAAGSAGSGGARTGCGAAGGGLLADALTRLAEQLDGTSRVMGTAVDAAGDTVASNAGVYAGADADAATHLGAAFPDTAPTPSSIGMGYGTGSGTRGGPR